MYLFILIITFNQFILINFISLEQFWVYRKTKKVQGCLGDSVKGPTLGFIILVDDLRAVRLSPWSGSALSVDSA